MSSTRSCLLLALSLSAALAQGAVAQTSAPPPAGSPRDPGGISFEAALKKFCPARNLEFLPPSTLAETTDAFVSSLPAAESDRIRTLAKSGVDACQGSADESCRTAVLLGTIRYLDLSEPLAQRFCGLKLACKDWFACSSDADQTASVVPPATPAPAAPPPIAAAPPPAPEAAPPPPPASAAAPTPPPRAPQARTAEAPPPPAPLPPPEEDNATASVTRRSPGAETEPVPPISAQAAVEGFYGALGRGDGIAAASFMIPEKRGRGNFSAAAMERFYGHLRRPLTLRSVEPIDPVTLQVRYDFATRAGATCDGRAIVRVRPTPSGTYIDTIRALSGC